MRRRYFAIVAASLTNFACTSLIFDDPTAQPADYSGTTLESSTCAPGTSSGGETESEGETALEPTSGDGSGSGSSTGTDDTTLGDTTGELPPTCGNGKVEDGEACDDEPDDGCANCLRRYIFVTEDAWNGSLSAEDDGAEWTELDGKGRANRRCRESAARNQALQERMVNGNATFKAWIGVGKPIFAWPAQSWPHDGPYVLPNLKVVADDWEDLTDGELRVPINVTETAGVVAGSATPVWTNVSSDGKVSTNSDCNEWTSSWSLRETQVGNAQALDSTWTAHDKLACSAKAHLYCVEVPCGQTPCE